MVRRTIITLTVAALFALPAGTAVAAVPGSTSAIATPAATAAVANGAGLARSSHVIAGDRMAPVTGIRNLEPTSTRKLNACQLQARLMCQETKRHATEFMDCHFEKNADTKRLISARRATEGEKSHVVTPPPNTKKGRSYGSQLSRHCKAGRTC
jgi:hypothetical protein